MSAPSMTHVSPLEVLLVPVEAAAFTLWAAAAVAVWLFSAGARLLIGVRSAVG